MLDTPEVSVQLRTLNTDYFAQDPYVSLIKARSNPKHFLDVVTSIAASNLGCMYENSRQSSDAILIAHVLRFRDAIQDQPRHLLRHKLSVGFIGFGQLQYLGTAMFQLICKNIDEFGPIPC